MAALTGKVYMITEANTDLGRALVFQYFQRPESTVIATIKTQDTPFEQYTDSVEKHFKTAKSVCIILRMDSADPTTFPGAVTTLQSDDHVSRIDVIIFNGPKINDHVPKPLTEVDLAHVEKYITHCTVGPLRFLQAMLPLLRPASSEHRPQFVLVGSANGSTYHMETQPANMGAYGLSMAAAHYLVRKLHFENEWLIIYAVELKNIFFAYPDGVAQIDQNPTDETLTFLLKTIDGATREETSGRFPPIEGGEKGDWTHSAY